jgi:hypothetical protein
MFVDKQLIECVGSGCENQFVVFSVVLLVSEGWSSFSSRLLPLRGVVEIAAIPLFSGAEKKERQRCCRRILTFDSCFKNKRIQNSTVRAA